MGCSLLAVEVSLLVKPFSLDVPEYDGPNDMKSVSKHIECMFKAKVKNSNKSTFSHVTNLIDSGNIKFMSNAVVAIILEMNLKASGLA